MPKPTLNADTILKRATPTGQHRPLARRREQPEERLGDLRNLPRVFRIVEIVRFSDRVGKLVMPLPTCYMPNVLVGPIWDRPLSKWDPESHSCVSAPA
jgi:hypothetical protein